MTSQPQSPPAGETELTQLQAILGHTLKLVPESQRELFAFEALPRLSPYTLAQVNELQPKKGEPNTGLIGGGIEQTWASDDYWNGYEAAWDEVVSAAQARVGAEEGKT